MLGRKMSNIKNTTVSAMAVVDLADELIARKMIDRSTLKLISASLEKVYQQHYSGQSIIERRVPETDLLSLWEIATSLKTAPALGIDIGQSVNINAKGLLANWLSCCDTLKQAMDVFHNNIALLNESESWDIKQTSQSITLRFMFNSRHTYPVMAVERSMVALVAWAEYFTGAKLNVQQAYFAFKQPEYSARYKQVFGDNVHFDADENLIVLSKIELNKKIHSSNPYLRKLIAEHSENVPLQAPRDISTRAKVESLLKTDFITYCHLESQLKRLNMSKATLYRKLKEEGCTFSDLIFEERRRILSRLQKVHTHYSNEQSSEALGFRDVSSFYKFLKKIQA